MDSLYPKERSATRKLRKPRLYMHVDAELSGCSHLPTGLGSGGLEETA